MKKALASHREWEKYSRDIMSLARTTEKFRLSFLLKVFSMRKKKKGYKSTQYIA